MPGATKPTGCSTASAAARGATTCSGISALLNALDLRLRAAEIVVTGPEGARGRACSQPRCRLPFLDRIVLRAPSAAALPAAHPAQAKIAAASDAAAFVCVGETCSLPVTDARRDRRDGCGDAALNTN